MKKNTTPPVTGFDNIGYDMMMPGEYQVPEMKNGGYTVTRSNDRKGKTHKVTGPDGTVKYFGDSKLGQHPKDPERKAAFYARHKENLEKNPYFRAFARKTWKEGGETGDDKEMLEGVADILRRVTDPQNREELAKYMMENFRDEKVSFKENEFLEAAQVYAQGGEMIKRADGSYSRRGMWDNIRANKGSGKQPTKEMLEQERKIRSEEMKHGGAVDLNAFYDQPRYIQTNIFAEGGSFGAAPVNTFMSPGTDNDPKFEQYYNQQVQRFTQSGVKDIPSRNDIYSYYQSANPVGAVDQTGRMVFSNPRGTVSSGATFSQAVDPVTGKVINQGTNLAKSAFDRQAQRFDFGGVLPEMAYGEEIPMVFSPEAQKQFAKSNASWGFHGDAYKGAGKVTPPLPTGTPMFYADAYMPGPGLTSGAAPVSGQPFVRNTSQPTIKADVNSGSVTELLQNPPVKGQTFERNMNTNFNADVYQGDPGLTTGAMMGMGPEIKLPANEKMQYAWTAGTEFQQIPKAPEKRTELGAPKAYGMDTPSYRTYNNNGTTNGMFNNRTYDALSMMAMLPLGNRGLAGIMKAGIGTAGFVGGLGTGVDNIYRGFKPRVNYMDANQYATPEMMQENPVYEMNRKQNTPFTPPKFTPGIPVPQTPMDEMRNTAAYGGEMPQYDFAGPVDQQRRWGLDPDGVSRAIGAAAGLGMVNDVVGYNQAFNNMERNQVRAGMSDMRGVSNPYMQQGYDVLNTGPGQTQAPNLYTPIQFAGNRNAGFFEEGGEYEMTEDQLRQFLANGGEVEYL